MAFFIFFIFHWYSSLFLQAFFHHRYAAHKHFEMSRNTERFFFVCCFLIHGSSYISPYAYGIMHRLHHMHTDTEEDPHSPSYHPGFFGTMLQTRNSYFNIFIGKTVVEDKLKKDLPQWRSFEFIVHNWMMRVCWMILYLGIYMAVVTAWWMYLFLPVTIALSTFQGTLINYCAHKFGYINYPMKNTSTNIILFDLIFIGEAYHNNHHKFPGRVKNSHRWFEIDPVYGIACVFQKLKVIRWRDKQSGKNYGRGLFL